MARAVVTLPAQAKRGEIVEIKTLAEPVPIFLRLFIAPDNTEEEKNKGFSGIGFGVEGFISYILFGRV